MDNILQAAMPTQAISKPAHSRPDSEYQWRLQQTVEHSCQIHGSEDGNCNFMDFFCCVQSWQLDSVARQLDVSFSICDS